MVDSNVVVVWDEDELGRPPPTVERALTERNEAEEDHVVQGAVAEST